ncbi:hypothetical protein Bca52824_017525 [Brassica carinata]|uniref:Uncharacterized protein n=1 Tax=Brassica carinata TaxID=52824 RepID=A0A8X7VMA0_BRACI|nr:hypothetical protein Bca52824_017525 [Brassica carinata]
MCIDENANGVGAEVANIDQAFEYAQSVSKENGDNDDDHGVSISNSESNRLQDVEIQYLEDTLHTHVVDSASKPSGSRIPATERLSLPELPSSPIRTLSEDRLHVSLRLEGLPDQYPDEDAPPKAPSQQKKRRGRPPLVSNSQALPEPPNSAAPKKTSFDGDSPVYVEDVVDTSRAAHIENGGDDDDGGYDYAPAA